jgi:hypothetical protein
MFMAFLTRTYSVLALLASAIAEGIEMRNRAVMRDRRLSSYE